MSFPGRCLLCACLLGLAAIGPRVSRAGEAQPAGAKEFHKEIQPVLLKYCSDCHADGEKKGGVSFDEFASDADLLKDRDLWWNVVRYLRGGLMPPARKQAPSSEEKERIAKWVKNAVFGSDPHNPDPGRVTLRRLNRVEYRNTIRDLMGFDFNAEVEFPPDDTGYGFDNIGDVLTLSPMLLEKYIGAARAIVAEAVPTVSKTVPEFTLPGGRFRAGGASGSGRGEEGRRSKDTMTSLPYDKEASVGTGFDAEHPGNYKLILELAVKGGFEFDPRKCRASFKLDGNELLQKDFGWYDNKTFRFEFDQKLKAGGHRLGLDLAPMKAEEGTNTLALRIVSVTVRGPAEKEYWAAPKNYERFFPRDPPEGVAERRAYAKEVLGRFASKAFRRPVDAKTVERLSALAEGVYSQPGKTFEAGIAHAMQAVISSPRFLFRMEENEGANGRHEKDGKRDKESWALVDEYALASRLSYFLWSTMPDETLMNLAEKGELRKQLPAQVKRMMDDPRSEALVQNFTGQWLQTRDLPGLAIDSRVVLARDNGQEKELREFQEAFRKRQAERAAQAKAAAAGQTNMLASRTNDFGEFRRRFGFRFRPTIELDRDLKQAMKSETEMFVASFMREDRDLAAMLDSDYTFLNERLATFYGLTNLHITGSEMRKVTLPPESPRGGVLTMGSVLAVTSNPDRTSPVKRGVFVLNNLLGTPAPPPPANVPALEATEKKFTEQEPTLRAALEEHRKQPLCSSCHSRMDPIGLGLENFNALGMWREKERGQKIEAGGKLITGESFEDVKELKHILATKHRSDFLRCVTEKLLTYALGRGLEYYDVETVDQIVARLDRENGHFSGLVMGIIESSPFQKRRTDANANFSSTGGAPDQETAPRLHGLASAATLSDGPP
jgi:mono/diheme cytochrome c family protein